MELLCQKINRDALKARAIELRNGISCSIPEFSYNTIQRSSFMGGKNVHVEIMFEDGVVWLSRMRRLNATSPPLALQEHILKSEYATMKFLEGIPIPTPRVFDIGLESQANPVGVGYIIFEKMAGAPLMWPDTSREQRKRVVEQLADIFIELRRYPFDRMGCLGNTKPGHIGAFASETMTDFNGTAIQPLGPFDSVQGYHSSSIRLILSLVLRDELYSQNSIDAYLIHRFLLDLIPSILPTQNDNGLFFLKHADDKGDHILVDEEYNITAIVDWEWAHTAPEALAFNSPIGFLPVGEFYDGVNTLAEEEEWFAEIFEKKDKPSLANAVRNGRLQHRFAFCCGYDFSDWDGFLGLFEGLRKAVKADQGLTWDEWKRVALKRYKDDEGLKLLLSRSPG